MNKKKSISALDTDTGFPVKPSSFLLKLEAKWIKMFLRMNAIQELCFP